MFNTCTNTSCRKTFWGRPFHIGLQHKVFCSVNCKDTHVYDAESIKASRKMPLNTFQCPHCNTIVSTSNPTQKICQRVKCQNAQREVKAKLRERRYLELQEERDQKMRMRNERNEAMEKAMVDAIARKLEKTTPPPILKTNEPFIRNCKYCSELFVVTDRGKKRIICSKTECRESQKKEQKTKFYEAQQLKWAGREEEHKEYIRQCNVRAKVKKRLAKLALQGGTVVAETIPVINFMAPSGVDPIGPMQLHDAHNEKVMKWQEIQKHVAALDALINNSTNKYQPLIDYLEANKIDDMSKVSELMTIIGNITSGS